MVSKKKSPLFVWGWEKSVPRDHRLSSIASLVMLNGDPQESGRIFLSHPHTHDGFLYYFEVEIPKRYIQSVFNIV